MRLPTQKILKYGKPVSFLLMSLPLMWLAMQWSLLLSGQPHELGFNPQEYTNRFTGRWGLRLLLVGLALSPLADIIRNPVPIAFRRQVGLFAFAFATIHLTSYVALDQVFAWGEIGRDILKRWYITIGMTAFVLLIPLALTSTAKMVRRLGAKRWKQLHKLVYAAAVLVVLHFWMIVKGNQLEPLIYMAILTLLLVWRVGGKKALKLARA